MADSRVVPGGGAHAAPRKGTTVATVPTGADGPDGPDGPQPAAVPTLIATPGDVVPRRRRPASRRRQRLLQLAFLAPAVVYLLAFFGYPVVQNVVMSFQHYTTRTFYTGEAPWAGWANYSAVIGSAVFSQAVVNTVLFTVGSIAGQFTLGLLIALYFRRSFPGSGLLRSLLLLPWLIPLIVSGAIWRWILDQDNGALNRMLAGLHLTTDRPGWLSTTALALIACILVNIWIGIPFNSTILHSGLQDIPVELYEAAALDGATGWKGFRYITWPLLRPVINIVLVLGVVYTLKVLDIILGLTGGGPANASQTIATQAYHLSFVEFDFGRGAAMGNILIVVSLAFAVLYLRANRRPYDE